MPALTVDYIKAQAEEILNHSEPPPIIQQITANMAAPEFESLLAAMLQGITEAAMRRAADEGANPMEAMVMAAGEAQVLVALILIAIGMRFRDLEYSEADTADVESFLRDVTGGE